MSSNGKNQFDSGRARNARYKDRAQLEFEDMLIDDFYTQEAPSPEPERKPIPVRFGSDQLAAFMDDSTIAAALIRGETFEADEHAEPLTVEQLPVPELLDMAESEKSAVASTVHNKPPVIKPIRPARAATETRSSVHAKFASEYTWRGVATGFAMGAIAAVCALAAVHWLM